MFQALGAYAIDLDKLAYKFIFPEGLCYRKVVSVFGKGILKKNKAIDRAKLAKSVFSDKKKLKILNALIHPFVIKEAKKLAGKTKKEIVIIDAPLLIEARLDDFVDKLIVVKASRNTQIKRCIKKGFSRDDIRQRIRCQLPLADKIKVADFIIDNSSSVKLTRTQVKKIWRKIKNGRNRCKD